MAIKGTRNDARKPVANNAPKASVTKPAVAPVRAAAKVQVPEVAAKPASVTPAAVKPAVPTAKVEAPTPPVTAPAAPASVAKTEAAVDALAAPVAETTEQVAIITKNVVAQTAKAAQAAASIIEKDTTMQTEINNTLENTADKTQAMFGDMNDRAKGMMEKNAKMVEEMNEMAKGNMEAMVESSRIAAKGMESISHDAAEFGRKSFEQATATIKSMAAVKSPTELFKLQSDFFRTSFDAYVAEASKNTEQMMKLAGDAAQPLSSRMAVAAEKVKQVA